MNIDSKIIRLKHENHLISLKLRNDENAYMQEVNALDNSQNLRKTIHNVNTINQRINHDIKLTQKFSNREGKLVSNIITAKKEGIIK